MVYEYFHKTARLTQELRRYNVSEDELRLMIERYPTLKLSHSNIKEKQLIITRSWNSIDYKRCVRYANEDYEDCIDNAVRRGVTTWGQVAIGTTVGGFTVAGAPGLAGAMPVGFLVVGPLFAIMDYGHEKDVCVQQKEKDLIRCEEKYK